MGFRGGFKSGKYGFKAWKYKAFAKSHWSKKYGRDCDADDDAGQSFGVFKSWKYGDSGKHWHAKKYWKKSWHGSNDDDDRGFGKKFWKPHKRGCDDRHEDKDDCCDVDHDWKQPTSCKQPDKVDIPLQVSDPCIYPEAPQNNAPEISSPEGSVISFSTANGNGPVAKVVATDLDPQDTLIFSITDSVASEDADLFSVDPTSGQIRATGDLQPLGSADGDSTYEIEVQVTDGKDVDTIVLELVHLQETFDYGGGAPVGN